MSSLCKNTNKLDNYTIHYILEYCNLSEVNILAGLLSKNCNFIQQEFYNQEFINEKFGICLAIYAWSDSIWIVPIIQSVSTINQLDCTSFIEILSNFRRNFILEIGIRVGENRLKRIIEKKLERRDKIEKMTKKSARRRNRKLNAFEYPVKGSISFSELKVVLSGSDSNVFLDNFGFLGSRYSEIHLRQVIETVQDEISHEHPVDFVMFPNKNNGQMVNIVLAHSDAHAFLFKSWKSLEDAMENIYSHLALDILTLFIMEYDVEERWRWLFDENLDEESLSMSEAIEICEWCGGLSVLKVCVRTGEGLDQLVKDIILLKHYGSDVKYCSEDVKDDSSDLRENGNDLKSMEQSGDSHQGEERKKCSIQ